MIAETLNILLVEDSPSDAVLFRSMLKTVVEFSFNIDHATRLAQAIGMLAKPFYDAVILDLGLPDSNGVESYEELRKAAPELPVIIVTGNDDHQVLTETVAKGADNFLIKDTFDGNRIAKAILVAIKNRLEASKNHDEN